MHDDNALIVAFMGVSAFGVLLFGVFVLWLGG